MIEYTVCIFTREEDFLEQFYGTVEAAVLPILSGEWQPNYSCNDRRREAQCQRLASGKLDTLTFDDAVLYGSRKGLAAIDVHLQSSTRFVAVRLQWDAGTLTAEKRLDMCQANRQIQAGAGFDATSPRT